MTTTTNTIVWAGIADHLSLSGAANIRQLSRTHASAVTVKDLARHAARDLYYLRQTYALYDVDKYFCRGLPDDAAHTLISHLLIACKLAPPILPREKQTMHWRKKHYAWDGGGVTFGVLIPYGSVLDEDDEIPPQYDSKGRSLGFMDEIAQKTAEEESHLEEGCGAKSISDCYPEAEVIQMLPNWNGTPEELWLAVCANHALLRAARWGLVITVQLLLQHGANPEAHFGHALRRSAWAGHDEVVKLMLTQGIDLSSGSVLYWAIHGGHLSTVRILVEEGNAITLQDEVCWGQDYPILYAAVNGNKLDILHYLLPFCQNHHFEIHYHSPFTAAVRKDDPNFLSALLNSYRGNIMTEMQIYEFLQTLPPTKTFELLCDRLDETRVTCYFQPLLNSAIPTGRINAVSLLLRRCGSQGATKSLIRVFQSDGWPAFKANDVVYVHILQLLLDAGADVMQDGGVTLTKVFLRVAAVSTPEYISMARRLHSYGPSFSMLEEFVRIVLDPSFTPRLPPAFWIPAVLDRREHDVDLVLRLLMDRGVDVLNTVQKSTHSAGEVPLLVRAVELDNVFSFVELLEAGADPDVVDKEAVTKLLAQREGEALGRGRYIAEVEGLLKSNLWPTPLLFDRSDYTIDVRDALRLLIDRGLDIDAPADDAGGTWLSIALEKERLYVVLGLIDLGADVTCADLNQMNTLLAPILGKKVDSKGRRLEREGDAWRIRPMFSLSNTMVMNSCPGHGEHDNYVREFRGADAGLPIADQKEQMTIQNTHHGTGTINVSRHSNRASLSSLTSSYPLRLLAPRAHDPRNVSVYALSHGGGLVSGDRVHINITVDESCALTLLTQGSTKVYRKKHPDAPPRSTPNPTNPPNDQTPETALQSLIAHVHPTALLSLLPDPITPFASASYDQRQRIFLHPFGSLILLDWFTSGRRSRGEEWAFDRYASKNEIYFTDSGRDTLVMRDAWLLEDEHFHRGSDQRPSGGGKKSYEDRVRPYHCYANLILLGPRTKSIADDAVKEFEKIVIPPPRPGTRPPVPELIWSVSHVSPRDGMAESPGVVLRAAALETDVLRIFIDERLRRLEEEVGDCLFVGRK
ncbi:hypothetical protein HK097_000227 [Rhizophlyctis rosea]|uniref:Uncharacterized protein n=1 Tax=Rhizophlyctis rosea TaxID=64517 RepID=A0AAD5WZM7_9FUNG|nr:hypothetical protein HK097_000227 [Rhizophlyctis rosea]